LLAELQTAIDAALAQVPSKNLGPI
jgi:hypothetical protein